MESVTQSQADALFALEEIHANRTGRRQPEGCELCQHCVLLQALYRSRTIEKQDRLSLIQGEHHNVK